MNSVSIIVMLIIAAVGGVLLVLGRQQIEKAAIGASLDEFLARERKARLARIAANEPIIRGLLADLPQPVLPDRVVVTQPWEAISRDGTSFTSTSIIVGERDGVNATAIARFQMDMKPFLATPPSPSALQDLAAHSGAAYQFAISKVLAELHVFAQG